MDERKVKSEFARSRLLSQIYVIFKSAEHNFLTGLVRKTRATTVKVADVTSCSATALWTCGSTLIGSSDTWLYSDWFTGPTALYSDWFSWHVIPLRFKASA